MGPSGDLDLRNPAHFICHKSTIIQLWSPVLRANLSVDAHFNQQTMCVCVCAWMRACVCVCVCACVRACVHVFVSACMHVCVCVCACMQACLLACVLVKRGNQSKRSPCNVDTVGRIPIPTCENVCCACLQLDRIQSS